MYEFSEVHGEDFTESERFDWWNESNEAVHQSAFAAFRKILNQNDLKTVFVRNARMYNNHNMLTYSHDLSVVNRSDLPAYRPKYNVIKSTIDTLANRIAKARPRPFFLTTEGSNEQKEKAKYLQRYSDGWFDVSKTYAKSKRVFKDACIFKCGFLKIFAEGDKIKSERVNPFEIFVDETDGLYEDPQVLYQVKWVPISTLIKRYPKLKSEINSASTTVTLNSGVRVCQILEAWKLNDKHIICIENACIVEEKYEKDYFPFAFFRYEPELLGFWGEDLVSNTVGFQIEIDSVMKKISQAQENIAVPRVFINSATKIAEESLNNRVGQLVRYIGSTPPAFSTAVAMNQETYSYLEWLIQSAYEEAGISKMTATSEKPAGLSSGKALRTYEDIQSDRYANTAQAWDQFFLDVCRIVIDLSAETFADGDVSVTVPGEKFIEQIPWKKISLNADEYVTRIFSTSLLPTQPAAKMEMVKELAEIGAIPASRIAELLDYPDLERFQSENLADATIKIVSMNMKKIIDEGKYQAPEPEMNLDQAYEIAMSRYLSAMTEKDVPNKSMFMLNRYVSQIKDMLGKKKEEEQAQVLAQQQAMTPPMSDMSAPPMPPEGMPPMPGAESMPEGMDQMIQEALPEMTPEMMGEPVA
jgi:hypothetical protein